MDTQEFVYRRGVLACENVELPYVADRYGTPAYVYSRNAIVSRFRGYDAALDGTPHRICFAVKANSNLGVLSVLVRERAGFDIVSGGELYRVLAAGGDATTVVFSGVGKTEQDIEYALQSGIHSFNCESEIEIETISRIARQCGKTASIALRVNPDVDAATHPYISTGLREHKFGVDINAAEAIYERVSQFPGIRAEGVSCHIGSQILDLDPLLEAADRVVALVSRLRARGHSIRYIDLGGGLGVPYRPTDRSIDTGFLVQELRRIIEGSNLELLLEPGRSIVAESGVLLTRVLLVKRNGSKTFVITDAGMNDLIRPSLYQAHHEIVPVVRDGSRPTDKVDVVGPVCETGDFFARDRDLESVRVGDLLAIRTVGAYGFVLASNYNSRPRPCELLIDGSRIHETRKREGMADLVRGESVITDE